MLQIWDTRNFEKPIISLDMERPVSRVSWCPTRPGLLASVARDSSSVSCHCITDGHCVIMCQVVLHDIMSWAVGHEDGESSVQDRSVEPPGDIGGNVAGFAWHPDQENTLLVSILSLESLESDLSALCAGCE